MRFCRLLGVVAVLVTVSAGALSAQPAGAAGQVSPAGAAGQVSTASGTTIGPVQISALGHPRLCWEAAGNGSAVTLEHCDRMLQGQQWSLTPDDLRMIATTCTSYSRHCSNHDIIAREPWRPGPLAP